MPRALLIIFFLACVTSSFAQGFIGDNKKHSRVWLEKGYMKDNIHIIISETDSTLICLVRDTAVKNLDTELFFDKKGKCYKEQYTFNCDSCFQLSLKKTLTNSRYEWQSVTETDYVSSYEKKLFLRTKVAQPYSYVIQRMKLSRKDYDLVVKK